MKITMRWLALALLVGLVWETGMAGTVIGTVGTTCYPPTYPQSSNTLLDVGGDWIENIDRVTAPAGVSVTIVAKFNGVSGNPRNFGGKGMVTLKIGTSNATPGNKTINLIDDPVLGAGGTTFSITITVAALPTVTSVDVPTPADPFNEITVTLNGTGLQEARDPAAGVIVIDNLIPFVTVGGNATLTSVRVLSSSSTSLQAKIFFSALIQDATVDLTFKSSAACSPLSNAISPVGFKKRVRVKSTNIKNYVESVTFPNGNTIAKNSTGTIFINLLFPAPSGSGLSSTTTTTGLKKRPGGITFTNTFLQQLAANALGNSKVFFKFVPENAFGKPDGTPFETIAGGFIEGKANPGEDIIPITFKVIDCLGGQPGQTNTVSIETWMHSTNSSGPPNKVVQTFLVRCIQ